MDAARFDCLAKGLSEPRSRRGVLAAALAGALGGVLTVQAKSAKIGVCHHTHSKKNPLVFIEVSAKAAKAHQAHGDDVGVNLKTDAKNCGSCGNACADDQACVDGTCVDVAQGQCTDTDSGAGLNCQCVLQNGDICTTPVRECFAILNPDGSSLCATDPCQCRI